MSRKSKATDPNQMQFAWFREPLPLTIDPSVTQPAIWIEELRLLADETALIRDPICFRRGLNVISSAKGSRRGRYGHDVGKTLLTRFLRYVLGEPAYAGERLQSAIVKRWPAGAVEAIVYIAGERLTVRRSFDRTEFDVTAEGKTVSSESYLARLQKTSCPSASFDWLELLAWLSRDQHCRYLGPLEWRSGKADSTKDRRSLLVRTVLGLADALEAKLLNDKHDAAEAVKQARKGRDRVRQDMEQQLRTASSILGRLLTEDDLTSEERLTTNDRKDAEAAIARLRDEFGLTALESSLEQARTELKETTEKLDVENVAIRDHQKVIRAIERGLRSRCPQSDEHCKAFQDSRPNSAEHVEQRVSEKQAEIDRVEQTIAKLESRRDQLQAQVDDDENKVDSISKEFQAKRKPFDEAVSSLGLVDRAVDLARGLQGEFVEKETAVTTAEANHDAAKQKIDSERINHESNEQIANQHFAAVLSHLFDVEPSHRIGGSVTVLRLLSDDELPGGEAISTASQVLAFDLAALRLALAGVGSHPRFSILDSPREADMDARLYHELFRLLLAFEAKCINKPAFQTIVTTTSGVPSEADLATVLRLGGRDEERLLGTWL